MTGSVAVTIGFIHDVRPVTHRFDSGTYDSDIAFHLIRRVLLATPDRVLRKKPRRGRRKNALDLREIVVNLAFFEPDCYTHAKKLLRSRDVRQMYLRPLLIQTSLEAIDTTARARRLLLARVGRVAGAAGFHRLRLDRARNLVNRAARRAGRFRVGVHGGVDSGLHSVGILRKSAMHASLSMKIRPRSPTGAYSSCTRSAAEGTANLK